MMKRTFEHRRFCGRKRILGVDKIIVNDNDKVKGEAKVCTP